MLPNPSCEEFSRILHICRKSKHQQHTIGLFSYMCRTGLSVHSTLGTLLVSMLVGINSISSARYVFNNLLCPGEWSWNAIISGYLKSGNPNEGIALYQKMLKDMSMLPSDHTFALLLRTCIDRNYLKQGMEIHAEVSRIGILKKSKFVGSMVVEMYLNYGFLVKAREVFDMIQDRDLVLWTNLLVGYVENGLGNEALECFEQMQLENVRADEITFICVLKACGSTAAIDKGLEIHSEVERLGLLKRNVLIGNTLLDMYAKCGMIDRAKYIFHMIPSRTVSSWNALIAGHLKDFYAEEALLYFDKMQQEGVCPDSISYICSLKACGCVGDPYKAGELHANIERLGFLESSIVIGSVLVDIYAKCGSLSIAQEVFNRLVVRDIVSWTALLQGYAKYERSEEALTCFEQMMLDNVIPNAVTFLCALKACASIGAMDKAEEIHCEVERQGLLEKELVIANSLVDTYAKCGFLVKAKEVFDNIKSRDIISWNSLISGFAQLGESSNLFDIFDKMLAEGMKPDPITFLVVLTACLRAGLVNKSETYFYVMTKEYGFIPSVEHQVCVVDLLSRMGQFGKASLMIKEMPSGYNSVLWRTMLGACSSWGNLEFGKHVFENSLYLDRHDALSYMSMRHISATCAACIE